MELKPGKSQTWVFPLKSQAKPVSEGFQFEDNKITVLETPLHLNLSKNFSAQAFLPWLHTCHAWVWGLGCGFLFFSQPRILNSTADSHSAPGVIPIEKPQREKLLGWKPRSHCTECCPRSGQGMREHHLGCSIHWHHGKLSACPGEHLPPAIPRVLSMHSFLSLLHQGYNFLSLANSKSCS